MAPPEAALQTRPRGVGCPQHAFDVDPFWWREPAHRRQLQKARASPSEGVPWSQARHPSDAP